MMNSELTDKVLNAAHDPNYCITVRIAKDKYRLTGPNVKKISREFGVSEKEIRDSIKVYGITYPADYKVKDNDWYLMD